MATHKAINARPRAGCSHAGSRSINACAPIAYNKVSGNSPSATTPESENKVSRRRIGNARSASAQRADHNKDRIPPISAAPRIACRSTAGASHSGSLAARNNGSTSHAQSARTVSTAPELPPAHHGRANHQVHTPAAQERQQCGATPAHAHRVIAERRDGVGRAGQGWGGLSA